jgi:hypothetical protein
MVGNFAKAGLSSGFSICGSSAIAPFVCTSRTNQ